MMCAARMIRKTRRAVRYPKPGRGGGGGVQEARCREGQSPETNITVQHQDFVSRVCSVFKVIIPKVPSHAWVDHFQSGQNMCFVHG